MSGFKSKIYSIILAIIILGYLFFFSSSCLFHTHRDLISTNIDTSLKLSENVSITLKKWVYSPNETSMLAMLSIENTGIDDVILNRMVQERHTTSFLSIETGTEIIYLDSELEYPTPNMVIVHVLGVPKGFEEIAMSLQLSASDEQEKENAVVSFFTNKDKVEVVDKIDQYSDIDYRIEYLRMQIGAKEQQIQELEKKNEELMKDNEQYQESIDTLKANQHYETAEEAKATLQRISSFEKQISTNNDTILNNKFSISEIQNSIGDIEATIAKLEEKK